MIIQILVDNPRSWVLPYSQQLCSILKQKNHHVELIHNHSDIKKGDVLFLLSCEKLLNAELRSLHKHNLVVHASDVPYGRGWSPTTWQVLEGKNKIPIVLLEAAEGADTGDVYLRDYFDLEGHELVEEIRNLTGQMTIKLCQRFIDNYQEMRAIPQSGNGSIYPRRRPNDAKLDLEKSMLSQFNLFRISDNEKYPVFFELHGKKYILKIYKEENLSKKK